VQVSRPGIRQFSIPTGPTAEEPPTAAVHTAVDTAVADIVKGTGSESADIGLEADIAGPEAAGIVGPDIAVVGTAGADTAAAVVADTAVEDTEPGLRLLLWHSIAAQQSECMK